MNIRKGYVPIATVEGSARNGYRVIDAARSVGKKFPVVVAWVDVKYGYLHFQGYKGTALEGISAIVAPKAAQGPNHIETITMVLAEGLLNGRDDRN